MKLLMLRGLPASGKSTYARALVATGWKRVGEDEVDEKVAEVLDALKLKHKILIVSGRDAVCMDETREWLEKHDIHFDDLIMRLQGDKRSDTEVKKEIYEKSIKGKYNVLGVFDDRDSVVQLWRSLGLKCYQCEYGGF